MSVFSNYEDYKEEIELALIQNACVEIERRVYCVQDTYPKWSNTTLMWDCISMYDVTPTQRKK